MVTARGIRQDFGLGDSAEGHLFVSAADAASSDFIRGQSHYIRRAFDRLRLDGVLCVDGVPTVYLKKFERPVRREEINELQRKLWNQGTGTLLVIVDPGFVYVFSSMVLPSDDDGDDVDSHHALVEKLDRVANVLEACRLVTRVASGQYYREHASKFQPSNTVDQHLLVNLGAVGDLLRHDESPSERKRVHAFLGRVIFACYLIDRGVIALQDYPFVRRQGVTTLIELLSAYDAARAKDVLYQLFDRLRVDFNGSMFETDLDEEKATISDDDIGTLTRFLHGDELDSRQHSLGFWAYDFSVIPVETISAIYEKFLEEEGAAEKDRHGAFYTPRHLAEMVVDEATSQFDTLIGKRCLDPACGSGIFLVILFNRIAEEIERQNPRAHKRTRVNELLDVLENQLCGVDVNKTACRIACFSLYIAFLDQFDPPTLIELQMRSDKLLPKLLAYKDSNYQNADLPVVYEGNFFDPSLPIRDDFDIIVGNPPWVGRNQAADAEVERWVGDEQHNPFLEDAPRARAKRKAIFLPQNQIAHAFMWKAPLHVNDRGRISLLLPVQVLLNKTDAFQHAWFAKMDVHRVFNLSDFRWFLFQDADRPATIIQYGLRNGDEEPEAVEYIVPKVRQQDPRSGLIRVFAEDRKWVQTRDVLHAARPANRNCEDDVPSGAAVFWKSRLWGSPRDVASIDYLRRLDCLGDIAGEPGEGKRWIKGQGFQPWYQIGYNASPESYGAPKPIPGHLDDPFIRTINESIQMFALPVDSISLRERLESIRCKGYPPDTSEELLLASQEGFRRSPDGRLFTPPVVLINKGFNKFAFVEFKVFYQHSLTGFHGDPTDADLLRFFTLYVKSRLARYFSFHTAASWGTERPEVRVHELMRLPFPLPDSPDSHEDAESIVEEIANRMKQLQHQIESDYEKEREASGLQLRSRTLAESRHQRVEQLQAELEPLVYRYFKLTEDEITLVEDTCRIISESATPTSPDKQIPTTQPTSVEDRQRYSSLLCETLNKWSKKDQPDGRKQPFFFRAEIIPFPVVGMTLLTLHQAKEPGLPIESTANGQLDHVVARLHKSATYARGSFEYLRGVIFGDGNQIHILKPDMLGQWTQTAALNDADQVFHAIVQSKRK